MSLNCNSSLTFTSRCPEIKMGQRVCHIINEHLPHTSTTKVEPFYTDFAKKNVFNLLKLSKMFAYRYRSIDSLESKRPFFSFDKENPIKWIDKIVEQLKEYHCGNCGENAAVADLILKMNGITNSTQARLKSGDLDHIVCAFNIDGSKVEKVINNKTIIVDPWAGVVDFANNAFKYYQNTCDKYFHLGKNKPELIPIKEYSLSSEQIAELYEKYPMFKIFKTDVKK